MLFLLIKHPSILAIITKEKSIKPKKITFLGYFLYFSYQKVQLCFINLNKEYILSDGGFYTMYKSFNKLPRLVQFILLLIPFVNWITEVIVRFSVAMEKKSALNLVIAILVLIFGVVFGWIDCIWVLLFHHLILAK